MSNLETDAMNGMISDAAAANRAFDGCCRCRADCSQGKPDGIARIAAERLRQISAEGWTPEHDAEHVDGALSMAAACYALDEGEIGVWFDGGRAIPRLWPWDSKWWKPKDRIRNLERAGALIAAEIDRLLAVAQEPKP